MNFTVKNISLLNTNLVTAVKVLSTLNVTTDIIRNNCNFDFYYNKTDVTPTILDGGDDIFWLIGPMINMSYVILIMIFQLRFQAILIFG